MSLTSDELNHLIYRYMVESGFVHSAFCFGHESLVTKSNIATSDVPPGALISFVQKGLQYTEIEAHLNDDGTETLCDEPFSVLNPHTCKAKSKKRIHDLDYDFGAYEVPSESATALRGHDAMVCVCCWNPILAVLATGSSDATIRLWNFSRTVLAQNQREKFLTENCIVLHLPVQRPSSSSSSSSSSIVSASASTLASSSCASSFSTSSSSSSSSSDSKNRSVICLQWSPDGKYLACSSYDGAVCVWNANGTLLSYSFEHKGPVPCVRWTADGELLVSAGLDQTAIVWSLSSSSTSSISPSSSSSSSSSSFSSSSSSSLFMGEELNDFASSKIIDHSIGYRHLIVVTTKNCFVYSLQNLSSPHMIDLKGTVTLILQCEKYFLLVDQTRGIQIFSYEGRLISNPKISALRPHLLKNGSISLSPDALALIDRTTPTQVHVLDVTSGKPLTDPITHSLDIMDIAFSQSGMLTDRKLAFVDRNRDLYICPILRPAPFKLASMVESFMWSARDEMLAAVTDQKLVVWYCPAAAFVDPDLLVTARSSQDATSLGKGVQCGHFDPNGRLTLRRADGTLICRALSPFPSALHRFAQQGQFARALRLCRLIKDEALWACLAVLALQANQLDTAEVALAAIDEADKVTLIQSIKHIPTVEGRNAELLVYKRRLEDAETLLIQAKLYYRAIKLNLRFFRFPRALELAKHYKQHIDLVIGTRQKYLTSMEQKETDSNFLALQNTKIDWDTIAARESLELKNEQERGTPYQSDVFSDNSSSASSSSSSSASST
eukprot:TRINITY_DN219_c0_g1_i2.p1 TRINITY_DN219_c0_g1~~TRINITY_DN219_c0_g1_i2.p1  ORF type:complete len:780 (+),score=268.94 TRINITY_DN219_c0_g1_i2:53-2392(+)